MNKPHFSPLALSVAIGCALLPSQVFADRYSTSQHDFGGVGLMQTPTARMAPVGEFSFNAIRVAPYSRYSISVQPVSWVEGTIRYSAITNRDYGPESFSGDQSFKDKGVDLKVRLWEESYWLPQVALGFRDLGGTGLFSSEYLVGNKRFYDLDVSLGVAWGYIGNRGDIDNPLGLISDRFDDRGEVTANVEQAGQVSTNKYFRGPIGFFGGVEYQTPWEPLKLKVEFDGNDYKSEPLTNNQTQDSPINIGAVYQFSDAISFTAG